jgi:hypothetical protein
MPRLEPVMTATLPVRSNGVFFIVVYSFALSPSLRGALATKQSILSFRGEMDCFASLAMTMIEFVIPGWSEGPDPESRGSGFALARPGTTV